MIDRNIRRLIESIKSNDSYVRIMVENNGTMVAINVSTKKFKHDVALALQQSIIDKEKEIKRRV